MKRKEKNNIYKVLYKNNRRRTINGFIVLIVLTMMFFGTLWAFLFLPALGVVTQQRHFNSEQFDKIDENGMTDGKGYIEFLDKDLNIVYPKGSTNSYTLSDVENMVSVFSIHQKVDTFKYIQDGNEYTQIISGNYNGAYGWYVKVDSDLKYVDSVNFHYIKGVYSQQDIDYILNHYIRDLRTYKYDFFSDTGESYTMVMVLEDKIEYLELYEIIILIAMAVFLLFIYTLFIVFSTNSTSKLFKRPLKDLSNAINDFSNGKHILINKEYKVEEFNSIVMAFNNMVTTLHELEQKNISLAMQKQSMIANISHDLKTPITVIQGYIDAIRSGKVPENEVNDYLNKISSKSEYLTALINSFADFSKLNHPDFKLKLKEENLCDVVRNYLADTYNYIIEEGIEVQVDIPDEKYMCKIDKYHFERSIANIISNFIKYNEKGTLIHISIERDKNELVLTMENNGTPIEKNIAKSIFDPLITGDKARSDESTGLGLASAKKVVELHGGKITYLSTEEYINSFKIILPEI